MFDQSSLNISAQKEEEITICGFKGCKIWILYNVVCCVWRLEIVGMTVLLIIIFVWKNLQSIFLLAVIVIVQLCC